MSGAQRVLRLGLVLVAVTGVTASVGIVSTGCGPFCRDIATRELDFACQDGANRFTGEIHFDRPTTFRTFLSQQCIPQASTTAVEALVDGVDWETEAVFVAVGPANIDGSRCVEDRSLERAQVCTDGLKIYFADLYGSSEFGCAGPRWTVAFALLRSDLRAALDAAASIDEAAGF